MSKELAFTDDNDVVKYLDTTTAFNLALTADGVAFDLTNAKSILVKIANDDGYIMQEAIDLTTVTSPFGGTLSFPINQDIMNTLVPDDYDIEVWVTMNDGTQAIFPSDGTLGFSIEDNLMSDTGEVIPTITLNDFQQQFDDLSNQMENAVQNVHKGDQGNPGNGIKSANNQYQLSDSPVTVPTGGWSDTILATTDQLPHLWTKIIFTYDDGTTKETNFVSSRGDTGSQGPIGPVGPQGKQGNGLVVRGKADKEENLPTTGNNQGDGYLVGTDLYIWIDDSWQNMGSITPDLADYVKVADMNNALSAKQDKIGYTPADDSKVVHNNGLATIPTDNSGLVVGNNGDIGLFKQIGSNGVIGVGSNNSFRVVQSNNSFIGIADTFHDMFKINGNYQISLGTGAFFTPADDSKVVHDNHDGTIKINGNSFTPAPLDSAAGKNAQPIDTDVDTLVKPGLYYVSGSAPNNPFKALMMLETKVQYDWNAFKEVQIAYEISDEPIIALRYVNPNGSLTSVGYASPWVFLSDDSKVAHLSGDEEIAGTKTFDTAPIDKTTGHPYITKDSVPAVPDTLADTTKDANFTGKLQKSGIDVATTSDVSNAVNAITSNSVNWTSLSVDSSQISDTDYLSNQTNCSYRISHNALYISGQYVMSGNNTSSHNSNILFKLPTNIVSQISFPSTNKFAIGLLQSLAQQPLMMGISLTNDGKITCATNPYDLSTTSGASMASGFINAAIPLN